MTPTTDQVKGVGDRIIAVLVAILLTTAVTKGWITTDQMNELSKILIDWSPYITVAISGAWGWWVNRPKAIVQSAAALPNTMVVTTPDLSNNTPETNIVSNITNKVVDTKTGVPTPSAQPITPPSDK